MTEQRNIYYFESASTNPFRNIAIEEQLLLRAPQDSVILYLWQNEQTVVIGRNQCAWRECHVDALEKDGGHLARRLSGGGAVYHDLGNLNFTFLYPKKAEDIAAQTAVIARAVASFGLHPEISGRNDITVDGRKFSGNAYFTQAGRAYHHGTLLLKVDTEPLARYLNVNEEKYRSKGVASVRSRVVNLCDLCPDITVPLMKERLRAAFEGAHGAALTDVQGEWMNPEEVALRERRFAADEWRLGRRIPFTWSNEQRFEFGVLRAELAVSGGIISDCGVFMDAMDVDALPGADKALTGCPFDRETVERRVDALYGDARCREALKALLLAAF